MRNSKFHPLNALWGIPGFHFDTEKLCKDELVVSEEAGDRYEVTLALQKVTQYREKGPKWARREIDHGWAVEWYCERGIPINGYPIQSSGFRLDDIDEWCEGAHKKLLVWVRTMRMKNNYQSEE